MRARGDTLTPVEGGAYPVPLGWVVQRDLVVIVSQRSIGADRDRAPSLWLRGPFLPSL